MFVAISTSVHAITVDIYVAMESGTDGDILTTEIMESSTYGEQVDGPPTWKQKWNSEDEYHGMYVSPNHARDFPGKVIVGGQEHSGKSTHTWTVRDKYEYNYVLVSHGTKPRKDSFSYPHHDRITVACFYTPGQSDPRFWNGHDVFLMCGALDSWVCMQTVGPEDDTGDDPPYVRLHGHKQGDGNSPPIKVIPGKTYWINIHVSDDVIRLAVFDPDKNYEKIGEVEELGDSDELSASSSLKFGRKDSHGDNISWEESTFSYFQHIMIDYTEGKFPLLPDNVSINNVSHNDKRNHQVTIYPNPSKGKCTIQLNKDYHSAAIGNKLSIYDLSGMLVDELTLRDGKFVWDNASVSNGTYVMRLEGTRNYLSQRLLLIR